MVQLSQPYVTYTAVIITDQLSLPAVSDLQSALSHTDAFYVLYFISCLFRLFIFYFSCIICITCTSHTILYYVPPTFFLLSKPKANVAVTAASVVSAVEVAAVTEVYRQAVDVEKSARM